MSFAENLKQARKDRGLSQEQLARLTGIINQEIPMTDEALDDSVRTLKEYGLKNASRTGGSLSEKEWADMAERIRQQKK